ncbi:MAG TPA: type I-U CRISPR-associated helicase/endonuclease Cas3 [Patescibacteria group bacterium]|nr:type I-U CRISPR-associated helicase/endonuclease Cas3 [Patescibacteria group bacterium]
MTLSVDDFATFFGALHGGHAPFAWQRRLLDHIVREGRWPDRIVAPTGAGKTVVIEVHVFAVALMAAGARLRVPRRLSLVVDRRALVDSQYERVNQVNASLHAAEDSSGGVLGDVARAIRAIRTDADRDRPPITVAMLRGGIVPSRAWVDDPTACAVLCATPDMWGSRLLLRGYGTSRLARPREAGLLAYDSVIVVDEAHLARQLVFTARRIPQLEATAAALPNVPSLQVVEATATPLHEPEAPAVHGEATSAVGVEADDLEHGADGVPDLVRRLRTPKPVILVRDAEWPATSASARAGMARRMADHVDKLLAAHGRTVACVVNNVSTAVAVAAELHKRDRAVELLVGRMRPYDVQRLRERRPGLLTADGDADVDVVVATQTIEVGIDADFTAMVTELAPGSALAQRAGRVNRLGSHATAEVRVFAPVGEVGPKGAPPYVITDLTAAMEWLGRREAAADGLAPWAISQDRPPAQSLRRVVLGRPEMWDAWLWARTSDELVDEPDLALWLADDLEDETDVAVVVRQGLPEDPGNALQMLRATPPRATESFPASLSLVRGLLGAEPDRVRYVWHDGDVDVLTDSRALRPGDVLVIDHETRWFEHGVVVQDGTTAATDVLEEIQGGREPFLLRVGARLPVDVDTGGRAASDLLPDLVATYDAHPRDGRDRRREMAGVIDGFLRLVPLPADHRVVQRLQAAQALLRLRLVDAEIQVGPRVGGGAPTWLVIADTRRFAADEEARQTWSAGGSVVLLESHQDGVAQRAGFIAERVGLGPGIAGVLHDAGLLHDEGKRDERFQRMLRGNRGSDDGIPADCGPLAKSGMRTPAEFRAARTASGLPTGWRHEQLSAAVAWEQLGAASHTDPSLITRLVGTSHGHGRSGFPHMTAGLVGDQGECAAPSRELYDEGTWDDIVEDTHRAHGVWGCAYLEALLRAADGQVSREGR